MHILDWNIFFDKRGDVKIQNKKIYGISSNKRRASNKRRPLVSAALMGIYIEISTSSLIIAASLSEGHIRIVTIFTSS